MAHLPHVHVIPRTVTRRLKSGETREYRYLFLRYRDHTGKEFFRPARTTDRRKAERLAAEWERELRSGNNPADVGWDTIRERYEDEYLALKRPGTLERANQSLDGLTMYAKPRRGSDVTDSILAQWVAARLKSGTSQATIAADLRHLRHCLHWAKEMGLLVIVPRIPRVKQPKAKGTLRRGRPITEAEFAKMLAACKTLRLAKRHARQWQQFLRLLWTSGLRIEEASEVSWDQRANIRVDLATERLTIHGEAQKSGLDNVLPLVPELVEFLQAIPPESRRGKVAPIPLASRSHISRRIASIGREAGIVTDATAKNGPRHATAHDLRRSFGSRWAPRLMPADLQQIMRHRSIQTTMEYYVSIETSALADRIKTAAKKDTPKSDEGKPKGTNDLPKRPRKRSS